MVSPSVTGMPVKIMEMREDGEPDCMRMESPLAWPIVSLLTIELDREAERCFCRMLMRPSQTVPLVTTMALHGEN